MPRSWTTGTYECDVTDDGVQFDMCGYTPLDMDWGCSLESYLTDPDYAAHVRGTFAEGTEAEVRAAVEATLRALGRPIPSAAPPGPMRAPPRQPALSSLQPTPVARPTALETPAPPLAFGTTDACALGLAGLTLQVGRTIDPSLPPFEPGPLTWSAIDRDDRHAPAYQRAPAGRVVLIKQFELQDGIGGPSEVFGEFRAILLELAGGGRVVATWDAARDLRVEVSAPASLEAAVRTVLSAPFLYFLPL